MTTHQEQPQPRALVVDDERQMRDIVTFALETQGFTTVEASDAEQAWTAFERESFDAIILDVMLPRASGIALCRRIRTVSKVPIILLTAKGEAADRVAGLEAGADDYVVKPFHPRELALRAMSVARRYREAPAGSRIVNGDLVIDPRTLTVLRAGTRVPLSQSEFHLLMALASRLDEEVGWGLLLQEVWGTDLMLGGRDMVKTAVYRLRGKLGDSSAAPHYIQSVRGRGYRMPRLPAP
ncbi:response regulator transcription factor [Protaetiibacter intestinalis]|uniref:Probable transcriptional regulator ycf27 n=1 Tax=Protaetiibacter intestinalis TaxID=2419774 RepID=A0A387BIQ8_9MICO|nr:response regulator transcription factor [Protaetiibacter intestinalis]AYF98410.1 DNA-binding response regulator [Protaetiibacter intestinalis]